MENFLLKLHLGCGERYLPGYLNIDFPPEEHAVQKQGVADRYCNILDLRYDHNSVGEIRTHHVLEHFPRAITCALLTCWVSWLKVGGILHIEVPDLYRVSWTILNPFVSFRRKAVAERHAFGSHEAVWAQHCEGYTRKSLHAMVGKFGFSRLWDKSNSWRGINSIEAAWQKTDAVVKRDDLEQITRQYLSNFLLDDSDSEQRLLDLWMNNYRAQVAKGWTGQ